MIQATPVPRGGGLTVDLEQLEIIYAQQWSSVASEIEATELHCTKPTAGGDKGAAQEGGLRLAFLTKGRMTRFCVGADKSPA